MGTASSVSILAREQTKPIDASDIPNGDFNAAKKELIRMRELLAMVDCGAVADKFTGAGSPASRSGGRAPNSEAPGTGYSQDNADSAKRLGGIPRTPPKVGSAGGNGVGQDSDEPRSGLESRAGKDYWANPWGSDTGQASTAKNPSAKAGTDAKSFNESAEGAQFWSNQQQPGTANSRRGLHTSASLGSYLSSGSLDPANTKRLLQQIRTKVYERYDNVRDAFLKIDIDKSGYISREEFRVSFAGMGIQLTDEEFEAIDHTYAHKERSDELDKGIGYLEFINLITEECRYVPGSGEEEADSNYFGKTTQNSAYPVAPSTAGGSRHRPHTSSASVNSFDSTSPSKDKLTRLQTLFSKKVQNKYKDMKEAFRDADANQSGFIEIDEFAIFVLDKLEIPAGDDDLIGLLELFDTNEDGKLGMSEFVKCLHTY